MVAISPKKWEKLRLQSQTDLNAYLIPLIPSSVATSESPLGTWFSHVQIMSFAHSTPVFLPGKSHGQRSLAGYSPWGHKGSDMTEQLHFLSFNKIMLLTWRIHNNIIYLKLLLLLSFLINYLFYFTLYWFCHTLSWIRHGCTCVSHPEPSSHLPPHRIPLGHPSAPALSTLYHSSKLYWRFVSHMIIYMFLCHSPISSCPRPLPQSPKDCSILLCLFCCIAYMVIITIFLNSIYMR